MLVEAASKQTFYWKHLGMKTENKKRFEILKYNKEG